MNFFSINEIYYYYKRQKWIFSYPFTGRVSDDKIDRPVFIVGHQGNGATIVSRIIRRANNVVTFSGNSKYFTGADEMQSAMGICLDYRLTGILHKMPKSFKFGSRRGWSYACNELLPFYKFDEYDCDKRLSKNLKRCIKAALLSNKTPNKSRFIDKSQSYALKIPMINKALEEHNPLFIAIVRNPLAVCWRSAYLKTGLSNESISTMEKLKTSVEHWNNTIEAILNERERENLMIIKIEDILVDLELFMIKIFKFIDIPFDKIYLPKANDKLPFGTKRSERWFPVKTEINEKYIKELPTDVEEYILQKCGTNMKRLGYI